LQILKISFKKIYFFDFLKNKLFIINFKQI